MRKAKVGTFVKRSKCKAVRVRIAPDSTTLRCASVYFHVSRTPFRIFLFNSISNHVLVECTQGIIRYERNEYLEIFDDSSIKDGAMSTTKKNELSSPESKKGEFM